MKMNDRQTVYTIQLRAQAAAAQLRVTFQNTHS